MSIIPNRVSQVLWYLHILYTPPMPELNDHTLIPLCKSHAYSAIHTINDLDERKM